MRHLNTFAVVLFTIGSAVAADPAVAVTGELKQWHKVTLTLDGPSASESGTPNPFTDFRFDVTFSNGALTYVVPGYFAADGNAGETSATSGVKWRAHLSPDVTGTWNWTIGFRQGSNVAQNGGGTTLAPYHGVTGSFTIAASDKSGRDFRGKGRLEYVNQRYLRHKGNNEWFIKAGADAPENFLNNTDIDGTLTQSGTDRRHTWAAHVGDWQAGDPSWKGGKGKGAIGALNYLASTGNNVFSFLTMNINGDSKDVWPYYDYTIRTRMDCSKLDQWEKIFEHADRKGLYLHFKTQETENETLLDGGATGNERKLYYRELIARFGHHLALNWNLGEENSDQNDQQRKDMAAYFYATDPYHHLVVLHTYPGAQEAIYRPLLGSASRLTGTSVQIGWNSVHTETRQWINESVAAGKPWVVANDEQGSAGDGIPPQAGWAGYGGGGPSRDALRHQTLWGNLMAGGAGVEAYFGYSYPDSDLSCRDWRSRADWWAMGNHALVFFNTHLPFSEMTSQDPLVGNASSASDGRYCLAKVGATYAVYIPAGAGGTATLDLNGQSGTYTVQWYNPRTGGALQNGGTTSVTGGGSRALGTPPADSTRDWVVLVKLSGSSPANQAPVVNAGANQNITLPSTATLTGTATDDGLPASTLTTTWSKVSGPGTVTFGNAGQLSTSVTFSLSGTYVLRLTASDGTLSSQDDLSVIVAAAPVPPTPPTPPASPTITGNGTATPTLSGTTQPGAVIHILVDGIEVGTTAAAGDGSWSYPITGVSAGTHTITVTASNAGGSSPASPAVTVTVAASGGSGSGSSSSGGGGGCGLGGGVAAAMLLGMLALCGLRRNESRH